MARTFGSLLGVSKQTEMLVMTVLTLWVNIFDMTLFEFGSNLDQVWNVPFDVTKFSDHSQHLIKILLSGVVFVRTFSLHLYIAFLIAMFWPCSFKAAQKYTKILMSATMIIRKHRIELYATNLSIIIALFWPCIFGTRPTLMLPWLTVSAVKNIGTGLVTFGTGIYTCAVYGLFRPACFRFVGSQLLDLSPSFYMWIVGLSLYRDLVKPPPIDKAALKLTEEEELNMALRRRKVKSMIDEEILRKQFESRRTFIGTSAVEVKDILVPSNFQDSFNAKISRSLDSLLDIMNAEAEILDGEEYEEPIEDNLSLTEKTAKLLGMTMSEISMIKQNILSILALAISSTEMNVELPVYPVQAQRKQRNVTNISNSILKSESPIFLLTRTSMYTPSNKPVRPTKSELKSPKDFLKLKSPSDFMQTIPESELSLNNYYTHEQKKSDVLMPNFAHESFPTAMAFDINWFNTEEKETFSSKYEMFDIKSNPEEILQPRIEALNSNEIKKSSEEVLKQTDYIDIEQLAINSSGNQELKYISKKVSHEIGCQVSTLSKRILEAPPKEMSEHLSKVSPKRSRTISIKPPTQKSGSNCSKRPQSSNSKKSCSSSPRENSYLGLYLSKLELGKSDNTFAVDKFGVKNVHRVFFATLQEETAKQLLEVKKSQTRSTKPSKIAKQVSPGKIRPWTSNNIQMPRSALTIIQPICSSSYSHKRSLTPINESQLKRKLQKNKSQDRNVRSVIIQKPDNSVALPLFSNNQKSCSQTSECKNINAKIKPATSYSKRRSRSRSIKRPKTSPNSSQRQISYLDIYKNQLKLQKYVDKKFTGNKVEIMSCPNALSNKTINSVIYIPWERHPGNAIYNSERETNNVVYIPMDERYGGNILRQKFKNVTFKF